MIATRIYLTFADHGSSDKHCWVSLIFENIPTRPRSTTSAKTSNALKDTKESYRVPTFTVTTRWVEAGDWAGYHAQ